MNKQIEEKCPFCHGTGSIGTTEWLKRSIEEHQLTLEREKVIEKQIAKLKRNVAIEVADAYNERLKYLFEIMGAQILLHLDQICEEFKKKYESEGADDE